jgi:DNA topoisomerase-1
VQQEKQRHPFPPFITSRLQQEAYRKLSFPAQKTMWIAQKLYEGVDLGQLGMVGLITYMRTDSVRVSTEAIQQVRGWIKNRFGDSYLPPKPNVYKSRRGAQEAHEAIRPTSIDLEPDKVKSYLDKDQWALSRLKRTTPFLLPLAQFLFSMVSWPYMWKERMTKRMAMEKRNSRRSRKGKFWCY